MDVRGPEGVPVHQLQQFAGRTIGGDGIRCGSDAVKRVSAVRLRVELAAEVVVDLLVVLLLVETWEESFS
jgi:hypothetical protein